MTRNEAAVSHVIVSQGYPGAFGQHQMQAWVENVNTCLQMEHFKVRLFTCGAERHSFVKNNVEATVSKRIQALKDPLSLDIPLKVLLSEKPSLAVIHGLQHLLTLFTLLVYFVRNVPVIIIVHGVYLTNSPLFKVRDRILKFLLHVFRESYLVIAITGYDKELLLNHWRIPPAKIAITNVFLHLNDKELQKIDQLLNEHPPQTRISETTRFLYVGRLDHDQKRVDHLIKLFHRFLQREHYPNVELVIVGRGPLYALLQKMVQNYGIQNYVKILGPVSEEEKWRQYSASTILLLVSKSEGLPRVIFEAFAAGKPVIVPDICGLREIVDNRINGFLFSSDAEFLQLLHMVQINPQNILAMRHITRQMIMNKFNFEANKEEMCAIIRTVAQ